MNERPRMKWQNLKDGRCPACAYMLRDKPGIYRVLMCSNARCPADFKIREDRLDDIISDPNSLANKYYRQEREERQGWERHNDYGDTKSEHQE